MIGKDESLKIEAEIIFHWSNGAKEVFIPRCFGDKNIQYTYRVIEEKWEGMTRIVTKAELISVCIVPLEKVNLIGESQLIEIAL